MIKNKLKKGVAKIVVVAALMSLAAAGNAADIQILSATVRDQVIAGAAVIIQKNGERSSLSMTNADGRAYVPESIADDPAVLLIVRNEGYSDLVAKCPCGGMTYAISPTMRNLDGLRIVLNWGANPADLDGHLAYRGSHVWFANQKGVDANLDVDHMNGYGPETITIARKHQGERYVYAVQNYSDRMLPPSRRLSESDAKVFVYVGQTLVRTYYVPKGQEGNEWTVFAISEAGELQDINTFSSINVPDPAKLTAELLFGRDFGAADVAAGYQRTPAPVTVVPASARKKNTLGEAAYRAGNYAAAIQFFQSAIEADSSFGQAYSNLGLVFQRSGRVAEALWANRKGIALASGPHAAKTRAGTHFNNGRIYEDAGQWSDALLEYRAAESETQSTTYEEAMQRMRQHGAI